MSNRFVRNAQLSEGERVLRRTWLLLRANSAHKVNHVLVSTPFGGTHLSRSHKPVPSRRFLRQTREEAKVAASS